MYRKNYLQPDYQAVRRELEQLAEPEFQKFSSSLIPNIRQESMLGVRLPKLRKIARRIAKEDWRSYLEQAPDDSFEEIMLQGMILGYAEGELAEIQQYIDSFLPKIDNWSVCDSFCSGLKITRTYPVQMWEYLEPYLEDDREYYIRFAVVMLIFYYVQADYLDIALQKLEGICHESYYVKMAVAWAVSIYYLSFPDRTLEFLHNCRLDEYTFNKALQKIVESQKTDRETKNMIRAMRKRIRE